MSLVLVVFGWSAVVAQELPAPWKFQSVGEMTSARASVGKNGGSAQLSGAAGVLWGKADRMPFMFTIPKGDFDLKAQLGGPAPAGSQGLAGVHVRLLGEQGGPQPDDPQTFLGRRMHDGMLQVLRRQERGGDTRHQDLGVKPPDLWLRVARAGDVLSFWFSADGQTWTAPRHSAMRARGRVAVGLAATGTKPVSVTQAFASIRLGKLDFGQKTSWLGNSLPGGGHSVGHVMNFGRALWVDPKSGEFFLNGEDENSSFSAWNADGTFRWFRENPNFQHGSAVAADAMSVYQALHRARGQKDGFVRIDRATGLLRGGPYLAGKLILGMGIQDGELILADATDQLLRYWSTAEMRELRSVPFARPGPVAVNRRTGEIWIIRNDQSGRGKSVARLGTDGRPTGVEITSLDWPRDLAVGKDGRLYVAESGPSQQVCIFDEQGRETGRIGAKGGVWSSHAGTVPGQVHPEKFNFPCAVALDDLGNLTVLNSGPKQDWGVLGSGSGTDLRKFDPQGKLLWELLSSEYVDCGDFLPGSNGSTVYSRDNAYDLDYSKPPGQGWKQSAFTIDPFRFPDDPRLTTARPGGSWMRTIKGQPFLIVSDMVNETLSFFRSEKGSRILVPSARFNRGANNRPGDFSLWRDLNGDGRPQETERTPGEYLRDLWGLWVDSQGDIWMACKGGPIVRLPVQRLDEHGNPVYDFAQARQWAPPEGFFGSGKGVAVERVYYFPETDVLYLSGYTSKFPKPDAAREWGTLGTELARFDNWTGTPKLHWRIALPYEPNLGGHYSPGIKSAAFAGDYIFLIRSTDARVFVHRQDDGKLVTTLQPGPEVGGHCGLIDIMHGLNAVKRADGEYVVILEDDDSAKNILLRWNPHHTPNFTEAASPHP